MFQQKQEGFLLLTMRQDRILEALGYLYSHVRHRVRHQGEDLVEDVLAERFHLDAARFELFGSNKIERKMFRNVILGTKVFFYNYFKILFQCHIFFEN